MRWNYGFRPREVLRLCGSHEVPNNFKADREEISWEDRVSASPQNTMSSPCTDMSHCKKTQSKEKVST